ncbi:MAG: DNA translocase FtsK 4TM domain-containing protein [Thioalkalivibrionaceae bacterium]
MTASNAPQLDTQGEKHSRLRLSAQLVRALREGVLLVLAVLTLYQLVALFSYYPQDPAWSTTGDGELRNLGGVFGAWYADLALHLLGILAYALPLFLLALAAWWLWPRRLRVTAVDMHTADEVLSNDDMQADDIATSPLEWTLRIVSAFILVIAAAGLATLHFVVPGVPVHAGGVLGDLVARAAVATLGLVGATLVLLAAALGALTALFSLRWIKITENIGAAIWFSSQWLRRRIEQRRDREIGARAKEARVEILELDRVKRSTRAPARVEPRVAPPPPTPKRKEELQRPMLFDPIEVTAPGTLPTIALLEPAPPPVEGFSPEDLEKLSRLVELRLGEFGVEVQVVAVQPGPVITRFELEPAAGVKVARISALAKDLARSLSVLAVRIVEVIPGKSTVGLEIPNEKRELVALSEILGSEAFEHERSPLTMALGKDIGGSPVTVDLGKMPHLLVAGTTGSGKSVGVNAMLISLLYKSTADDVRLILIDPKMLELSIYEGIPHLLCPVVTDMKDASNALRWAVGEMERRYKLMSRLGVRNIAGCNKKIRDAAAAGEPIIDPLYNPQTDFRELGPQALQPMPYIVVVVDEFADMMMVVGKKVEELIARLAQKARAAGIHLILATQRPSVDVITGLIKANIPTRIAFQVSSRIDSRTILDQMGAEHLLGNGDMLYLPTGRSDPTRVHGAFVSDGDVHRVVDFLKAQGAPQYDESILEEPDAGAPAIPGLEMEGEGGDSESDPLYDQAVQIVLESRKASISYVQRRLKVGYNRAARMIETMEAAGIVSGVQGNGNREVLVPNRSEP